MPKMWMERTLMAKILVTIKIFPKEAGGNLEELKQQIQKALPSDVSVHKFDEEPIAFGLVAVVAHIIMPEEKAGIVDIVEKAIRAISSVSELQVAMVRRV